MQMRRFFSSRAALALAIVGDLLLYGGAHRPLAPLSVSLETAIAAQEGVTDDWLSLTGVVGTAVGMDRGGRYLVKVYLEAPNRATLAALPPTVDGVPVRSEVIGPVVSFADPPTWAAEAGEASDVDPKRGFPRPVPIGVSTGHTAVTAGTIGARVTDGVEVYALSNNHVYANGNDARPGDELLQPGTVDGGRAPDDVLGTLHDFEPIVFCAGPVCPSNRMDAAIALTTTDGLGHATPGDGYGSPRPATADAALGMAVQKYGRTTGHTEGVVSGINATIDVRYRAGTARFVDQVILTGDGFSTGGDSGSLIVTDQLFTKDRRPLALLFAGSRTNTIANPVGPVLDRFGVRVDGG